MVGDEFKDNGGNGKDNTQVEDLRRKIRKRERVAENGTVDNERKTKDSFDFAEVIRPYGKGRIPFDQGPDNKLEPGRGDYIRLQSRGNHREEPWCAYAGKHT